MANLFAQGGDVKSIPIAGPMSRDGSDETEVVHVLAGQHP